jgi:hypothetical protein
VPRLGAMLIFPNGGGKYIRNFSVVFFSLTSNYRAVSYINQRFYAGLDDSRTIVTSGNSNGRRGFKFLVHHQNCGT